MGFGVKLGMRGESRELVDQAAEPFDLADDGRGALLEEAPVVGEPAAQAPPQALGGELDRRERVLDLVGDPLGDLPPGGEPLGGEQLR